MPPSCGNVLGRLEHAEGARALGVRLPFRNLLSIKMRHLLKKMYIMEQNGAVRSDREGVAVAWHRGARAHRRTGPRLPIGHGFSPSQASLRGSSEAVCVTRRKKRWVSTGYTASARARLRVRARETGGCAKQITISTQTWRAIDRKSAL
jgi:hypothetical protein